MVGGIANTNFKFLVVIIMLSLLVVICAVQVSAWEENWSRASDSEQDGKLIQVHVLFRHGHRVPQKTYPTDPNNNAKLWDFGLGQITNMGLQQGYAFGVGLRKRYSMLLPEERAWMMVRAESSDVPRTLMTMSAVLAGLLPAANTERWDNSTAWRPAPIHTKPTHMDNILSSNLACPKLKRHKAKELKVNSRLATILKYIEEQSKRKMTNGLDLFSLYTLFEIEKIAGLGLPDWIHAVYPEPMKKESVKVIRRSANVMFAARLRSGPLLNRLVNPEEVAEKEPIRLYATHDTVIAGLLTSLGVDFSSPPGFVSAIAIEYRITKRGIHGEFLWRNQSGENLSRIMWPGCGKIQCPLNEIRTLAWPLIPKDWEAECKIPEVGRSIEKEGLHMPTVFICISAVTLIVAVIVELGRRRRNYEYLPTRNI